MAGERVRFVRGGAFGASHLPGTKRMAIPDVSHWLMLDDPGSTSRALEEVLR